MKSERLTWGQMLKKYYRKWVLVAEPEFPDDGFKTTVPMSGIVIATSDDMSRDEMFDLQQKTPGSIDVLLLVAPEGDILRGIYDDDGSAYIDDKWGDLI